MTPERWKQIEALYLAALEQPPELRRSFVIEGCRNDEELRRETEALLEADGVGDDFLARTAVQIAAGDLSRRPVHALAGMRIAQYEILSPLGSGGMGEVYLAQDCRLGRKVAVKFLYPESMAAPWARHRLLSEAQAAAALDHPSICTIYEAAEAEGFSFIVMQYLQGETLAGRLNREPIEFGEAVAIALQVAQALAEAHRHGIIHRDIKPQNILLTRRGAVKVLDFGLAKRVPHPAYEPDAESVSSEPAGVVGTAGYMSPEQARGGA